MSVQSTRPSLNCLLSAVIFAMVTAATPALCTAGPPSPIYAFENGRWWNGTGFVSKTMYVLDGELRSARPPRLDETIDLHGQYVIPPLADGHNHWVEPTKVEAYNACYLADGVYYVKDMANAPWVVDQIRDKVNLPTSVDFVTALQGFTGPGAHPIEAVDYLVQNGVFPRSWKPPYDPEAEFVVRTAADVDRDFHVLIGENPAYVKIFLLFSERYKERLNDPAMYGNYRGMDPALVPHFVAVAHAAGLKVMAHVYSVADFRTAVAAGVDGIQHLPGVKYDPRLPLDHYFLTPADAAEAKRRGATDTPTIGTADENDSKYAPLIQRILMANLKLLKENGVPILVGSDLFRRSSLTEVLRLRDTGVFTNGELLTMATGLTTADIFPNRKLGRLEDGYEANFLVLKKSPLSNLDNLRTISLRVKQGRRLSLPADALSRKSLVCIGE